MDPRDTVDDVSSVASDAEPIAPVVVLVQVGTTPRHDVLPADGPVNLGRRSEAGGIALDLDDDRMSRDHATVRWDAGAWVVTDRGSRNGTYVDGERISGDVRVRGNAVVRLGTTLFLLVADGRGYGSWRAARGDEVIGPELARVYERIRELAQRPTLLVHGESGAGKELAARLYHRAGPRSSGPFVAVNCAAIPEGVAERLLFGSRKGAFSGATDAAGYLQSAHGGTLFLDEIADLDPSVQAKLLRALETREVVPVGATAPIPFEAGVVAASHRPLRAAVAAQDFREDLYYRLARSVVELPPLRSRKLDIVHLVRAEIAAVDSGLAVHPRLVETCCLRAWPGNVRELRSAIHEAAQRARGKQREVVRPEDLDERAGLRLAEPRSATDDIPTAPSGPRVVPGSLDRQAVVDALAAANGVIKAAAQALGIHRTQLYRLMEKFGIDRGP